MIPRIVEIVVERIPDKRWGGATWLLRDVESGQGRHQYKGGSVWGALSMLLSQIAQHYLDEESLRAPVASWTMVGYLCPRDGRFESEETPGFEAGARRCGACGLESWREEIPDDS